MVQSPSTSTALVALLALTTVLSDSATALPTHRSSSAITRRAHLASHLDAPALLTKRTNLGDHSVYVDASTSHPGGTGGVRNSTINLTVVSKRDSTLSAFSRVVRSLFRRSSVPTSSTSSSLSSSSSSSSSGPQLVALPQHTAAPYTKGHRTSRRQHQAQAALSRRAKSSKNQKRALPDHPAPRIGVVVPPRANARPKNVKRAQSEFAKRQNYDGGNEQASIYAAAIAAMDATAPASSAAPLPPQVTAEPVALNAKADSPPASLGPITVTMTLVPAGPNGEYVDAAAATPTLSTSTVSASASASADAFDSTAFPSSPSATVAPSLADKLRQRRSTFAERKAEHHAANAKRSPREGAADTSRLNRRINPKTGVSPSTPTSTGPSPASQVEATESAPAAPQWTVVAHF
ncbi:hypothetical protein JCM11491_006888 [Sporobolomyces phaffii]